LKFIFQRWKTLVLDPNLKLKPLSDSHLIYADNILTKKIVTENALEKTVLAGKKEAKVLLS
jgi:hypothetical protein